MYRVFEALDELNQTVEHAYGVPMTSNCMVPRQDTMALLDDLRNALPIEIDDAQDVLDKQEQILRGAEEQAHGMVSDAETQAAETIARSQDDADAMIADAQQRAAAIMNQAQDDADHLVDSARREADETVHRAKSEADRLISDGEESYRRSVDEGMSEQQRLVSDSEVVRRSSEEARRIVETAHTDSNRLRNECDEFVDSKLGEFEETLSSVLRSVTRDRSALRRGAGAVGSSSGDYGVAGSDYTSRRRTE
ncbi:DivIVA domain-containing protein [Corynebacterium alimapuense]|uniref:DivIVA domain-containing protein n=1 Tax=Corynebacterium alimapuense TaxID=1576874 RepID=A0A3M8K9E4_9CORY|nr:DivIVA domain-containing protein [Corynebacterium alimapuense]RNE49756.1 hypothetical protein C5L39_03505 [Corynebacterium alimapuense]